MTNFVLVPGAGGTAWYWTRLVPLLEQAGHTAIAVDLPGDDETAGLPEYTQLVVAAIGDRDDLVLVAQSLGGFTAPMVAGKVPLRGIVFVNAMIPAPGETPGDWWRNTASSPARIAAAEQNGYDLDFDPAVYFLHDLPPDVAAEGEPYQRPEADVVFESVCEFSSWPSIPIKVVAGADDRFFPSDFQQRVAHDRLGIEADIIPGGHLTALSQPAVLASHLMQAPW